MDSLLLTKIISALVYPLGLVLVFWLLRILSRWIGAKRWSQFFGLLAGLALILASNPMFASWLAFQLERQYPQQEISDIARHDAIIVLGGGLRLPQSPAKHTQIGHGSDRFWYATKLFRAGKANSIILTGGNVYAQSGLQSEAFYASQLLQEWGVPRGAILFEGESRTTQQNRQNTASFLVENNITSAILVTSAIHMPRAHREFSRLPIPITPASADVLIRHSQRPAIFNWIPSASALQLTTVALHEYYGRWFSELNVFISKR